MNPFRICIAVDAGQLRHCLVDESVKVELRRQIYSQRKMPDDYEKVFLVSASL